MAALSCSKTSVGKLPSATNSSIDFQPWNLRIFSVQSLPNETVGQTAQMREPSGKRESSVGLSLPKSSPNWRAMFFTPVSSLCASRLMPFTSSSKPYRSTKTRPLPFTMTSETLGSSING